MKEAETYKTCEGCKRQSLSEFGVDVVLKGLLDNGPEEHKFYCSEECQAETELRTTIQVGDRVSWESMDLGHCEGIVKTIVDERFHVRLVQINGRNLPEREHQNRQVTLSQLSKVRQPFPLQKKAAGPLPPLMKMFETGAVRSTDADSTRYDLVDPVAMRRLAETYAEGAAKYGDSNWLKGIPVTECLNHCLRHVFMYLERDKSEDHLAHASWNLFAAMRMEGRSDMALPVRTGDPKTIVAYYGHSLGDTVQFYDETFNQKATGRIIGFKPATDDRAVMVEVFVSKIRGILLKPVSSVWSLKK